MSTSVSDVDYFVSRDREKQKRESLTTLLCIDRYICVVHTQGSPDRKCVDNPQIDAARRMRIVYTLIVNYCNNDITIDGYAQVVLDAVILLYEVSSYC